MDAVWLERRGQSASDALDAAAQPASRGDIDEDPESVTE